MQVHERPIEQRNHIYATWNNIMIPLYHTLLYINFISIMSRRVRTEKRYKYLQAFSQFQTFWFKAIQL